MNTTQILRGTSSDSTDVHGTHRLSKLNSTPVEPTRTWLDFAEMDVIRGVPPNCKLVTYLQDVFHIFKFHGLLCKPVTSVEVVHMFKSLYEPETSLGSDLECSMENISRPSLHGRGLHLEGFIEVHASKSLPCELFMF